MYTASKETINSWPWPEFPLFLHLYIPEEDEEEADDFRAVLRQRNRIRGIQVFMVGPDANWFVKLMGEDFPRLRDLDLTAEEIDDPNDVPYISFARFLGGPVPSLQHLSIDNFEYEGLLSLLSSAPNLISLEIKNIRLACYLSLEEMVGALARLPKLRELIVSFWLDIPTHKFHNVMEFHRKSPRSLTRAFLPSLTKLQIGGEDEYLENLIHLIHAPRLKGLHVKYLKPGRDEDKLRAGNLSQFISRTETFKYAQFRRAEVTLSQFATSVVLDLPRDEHQQARLSHIIADKVWSTPFIDTVSHMANFLGQLVIMLSDVRHLSINYYGKGMMGEYGVPIKNIDWVLLLRSFSAVELLHVHGEVVKHVASALKDIPEEVVAQVLPALQLLWLDDGDQDKGEGKGNPESVDRFLSLRKQSGRPVAFVNSREEFIEILNPHQLELSQSPRKISADGYEWDKR